MQGDCIALRRIDSILSFLNLFFAVLKATAGIEPAEQKVCIACNFKIKEIIEPFVAVKGVMPFSKIYIGVCQTSYYLTIQ